MSDIKQDQRTMHGKELSEAVKGQPADAVPGSDKAHAHSHAAHLETEGKAGLAHESIGKQGREPGAINQPPQDPRASGKNVQHHG